MIRGVRTVLALVLIDHAMNGINMLYENLVLPTVYFVVTGRVGNFVMLCDCGLSSHA
jgi:hypothetical protein